jgi:hypothetical protein
MAASPAAGITSSASISTALCGACQCGPRPVFEIGSTADRRQRERLRATTSTGPPFSSDITLVVVLTLSILR